MKLKDLHSEVCALGFDDYIECDRAFTVAANCALRMIFAERGVLRETSVYVRACTPTTRIGRICHTGSEVQTLPLFGKAYSLRAVGRGEILITDGADTRLITFDSEGEMIRGFLKYGGSISLRGDYNYTVYDLCTFSDTFSDTVESIPDGSGKRSYSLSALIADFGSMADVVRNGAGCPIPDATIVGDTLTLPEDYDGRLKIVYRRTPRPIDHEKPEERIDIPGELRSLLPLATAAFICIEGDAEKSEYYTTLYRRLLSAVDMKERVYAPGEYSTNGWA